MCQNTWIILVMNIVWYFPQWYLCASVDRYLCATLSLAVENKDGNLKILNKDIAKSKEIIKEANRKAVIQMQEAQTVDENID